MRSLPLLPRAAIALACALVLMHGAHAQTEATQSESLTPVDNSSLDAPLFYQLIIGEMELRSGEAGTAFQVLLDAARKTRDESLFRRATQDARTSDQTRPSSPTGRWMRPRRPDSSRERDIAGRPGQVGQRHSRAILLRSRPQRTPLRQRCRVGT